MAEEGVAAWAWVFGLAAFLLIFLAAAEQGGFISPDVLDGWNPSDLVVAGVLFVIVAAAVYSRGER